MQMLVILLKWLLVDIRLLMGLSKTKSEYVLPCILVIKPLLSYYFHMSVLMYVFDRLSVSLFLKYILRNGR